MLEMMLLGTGSGLLARLLPQIGGVFAKTAKALWQAKLEKQRHTREKEILQIEIDGKLHIADLNSKRDIAVSEHQLQQAEAQIASNNYAVSQERYQKTNDALLKLAVATREHERKTGFYGARTIFYLRAAIVPFIAIGSFIAVGFSQYLALSDIALSLLIFSATNASAYFIYPGK